MLALVSVDSEARGGGGAEAVGAVGRTSCRTRWRGGAGAGRLQDGAGQCRGGSRDFNRGDTSTAGMSTSTAGMSTSTVMWISTWTATGVMGEWGSVRRWRWAPRSRWAMVSTLPPNCTTIVATRHRRYRNCGGTYYVPQLRRPERGVRSGPGAFRLDSMTYRLKPVG